MGPEGMVGFGIVFLVVYLIVLLVVLALSVTMYVLNGLAIKRMSESCGLAHGWMGFVPYASTFRLGQLAECADKSGGKRIPWRHLALGGHIAVALGTIVFYIIYIRDFTALIMATEGEISVGDMLAFYAGIGSGSTVMSIFSLVVNVILYIVYWKIFCLFDRDHAVLFLLLSIFFSAAIPFLLFAIRRRTPYIPGNDVPPTAGGPADWT
ncbi:MAG: hypothetical protein E7654_02140 [Ruminococcaceae bacterium]|nr:hypothetical protein [Oscillospiraceae bacterium]